MASRPEPEWDDVEVGWFQALQQWRDEDLCECGCGWPKAISQDPMTEFRVRVPLPVRCQIRTALAAAQKNYRAGKDPRPEGLIWAARIPGIDE